MQRLPPPVKLDFCNKTGAALADSWRKWREEFTLYCDLALGEAEEIDKIKMFKYLVGPEGREIYSTQHWESDETDRTITIVLETFDRHCEPQRNETVERFKLNMRQQGDETFESFLTDIKTLAKTCNYGNLEKSILRDRIVVGIKDTHLRERLLRTKDLDLQTAEDMCRASEITKYSVSTLDQASAVHKVNEASAVHKVNEATKKSTTESRYQKIGKCKFCGTVHEFVKEKCPAFGQTCRKCNGINHFESMCYTKMSTPKGRQQKRLPPRGRQIRYVMEEEESEEDLMVVQELNSMVEHINYVKAKREVFATMKLEDNLIKCQLDSGATCNVIPKEYVPLRTMIKPTSSVLRMFNKTTIKPMGKCELYITNPKNGNSYMAEFIVINEKWTPIIGSTLAQRMKLITVQYENILSLKKPHNPLLVEDIHREFADVFEGNGHFQGKYHLSIDPEVTPVVHPPRKVPVKLKDHLKRELNRLEEMDIITPVTEPTPWVSSMVTVVKPDKLRICIDPKDLNKALKRSHYPLPTIEDILPELHKARIFSILDARNGFWHVELDKESSLLTTFNTPFGRYRWLRMPFGISTAPEEYQRRQDQVVEGLKGVHSIVDDILVYGEGDTDEEAIADHDEKLKKLLLRCRERGLKLNKHKLRLRQKEVRFIGHLITADGLKPDPEKVRAVEQMPEPTDVAGVRRFIGFVNYLSKFVPSLSDKCEPLRKLTLQESDWFWTETHSNAIREIKKIVTSQPVLKYFDPKEPITVQCDASDKGLGAALLQKNQPVAYASRALTGAEMNYVQIEKELLAVVFGMEKFHQYVYGQTVTVHSDHKPLEIIKKKSLLKAPKRLQRMLLRLQNYHFEIVYQPGKLMYLADTLSRAYLQDTGSKFENDIESINMANEVPMSNAGLEEIRKHTERDSDLQVLQTIILKGWPDKRSSTPCEAKPYFHVRDELSLENGLIFKGERVVIPMSLRAEVRARIHSSHIGIEGCLRRARECVYWPNMNKDVREDVQGCDTCREHDDSQGKETLIPHSVPNRPWSKIGCDLFTLKNRNYLVTVDYFSNFIEIDYLESTKSSKVIRALRIHFARYGIPDTVVSDNGPQFTSQEFMDFQRKWGFEHVTSSPGYPQSNGKAEQAVKTAKRIMLKALETRSDPYLALLDFRNTPTQGMDSSPVQRLMNRRTKTLLPTKETLLKPQIPRYAPGQLQALKQRQSYYYNRGAKDLKPLNTGDAVRIAPSQGHGNWRKGIVQEEVGTRSYNVETEEGQTYRRNRRHLRTSYHTPKDKTYYEEQEQELCEPRRVSRPASPFNTLNPTNGRNPPSVRERPIVTHGTDDQATTTRSGRKVIKPVKLNL